VLTRHTKVSSLSRHIYGLACDTLLRPATFIVADRPISLLKACPGEKSRARALAPPQPGMAGQDDTGAAEQSSCSPLSAESYAAAAEAAAAAAMRLISAHTRWVRRTCTCGSLPPIPPSAPTRSRMPTPRLGLPLPRVQSVSSRNTYTHVGTRHQWNAATDKERRRHRTRCPSPVTRCRSPVTQSISKLPVYFGGACGESAIN